MDKETLATNIVRAIAYTENGGQPDADNLKAGKTGEAASIFQFLPTTWNNYSKQVFGKVVPMNPDNETAVVLAKVKKWLDKGYDHKQIASMWNAGSGEPDAHSGKFSNGKPSMGVNKKYGVKYDVPGYANKVDKYYKQFMSGEITKQPLKTEVANSTPATIPDPTSGRTITGVEQTAPTVQNKQVSNQGNPAGDALEKIMSILKNPPGSQMGQEGTLPNLAKKLG